MIKAIVAGASLGGIEAIRKILFALPANFNIPVVFVLHIGTSNINSYISMLNDNSVFTVKEAEEKEYIKSNTVYFAPPNYHLLVEKNHTFSLSTDEKVNFSRPSIDVLFETAAWTYKENLLGILLTGMNNDGAAGLQTIKKYGGITITENPETAHAQIMPRSAIEMFTPDFILDLKDIPNQIIKLTNL
ncbi:MAG TPA: chemotaxis protein CheB [Draconibacterium sp.]|nr:chemotaxis protein CheB [Draconibacterium sp.]